jgi:ferric enterobactin receptor
MGKFFRNIVCLFFLLVGTLHSAAQQTGITVIAEKTPLSGVLEELTGNYGIRFAYDADSFQRIEASFTFLDTSLEELLRFLEKDYAVSSRQIDGTWVLVAREIIKPAIPETRIPEVMNLTGYVRDKNTGESIIYCNLAWGESRGGMTNELGFFSFPVPAADSVKILVSHLGYRRLDTIVSQLETVRIFLNPSEIMIDPISVVHYEKQVLQASPQPGKIAFNPLKSSALPRIASDDLGNALLLIPGVEFLQGGTSGLTIRGGAPTDNLVLFDGIPVLETSHLLGNMSVLNSKFVQQAFVSRGGFDAGFGGRVSGLIEITGKSGKKNKPYLELSANLLNSNVLANLPLSDKFSVTAAWRRSFIDRWQNYLYLRLIDDVSAEGDNPVTSTIFPEVRFQDVNAKLSFHPSENLEVDLNLLYGSDRQSRDFELLQTRDYYRNESLQSEHLGMSLNWKWQLNNKWFHFFSAGFSTFEKDMVDETGELQTYTETIDIPGKGQGIGRGVARTPERTFTRETHDIDNGYNHTEEIRAEWKTRINAGNFTHEAGAGWTRNSYTYNFFASRLYENLQIDTIANNADLNLLNAFVQQNIDLSGIFKFRWGLRTNYDPVLNRAYWQPRGGLEYSPVKDLRFYFLSGVYYQFLSGIRRFDSEGRFSRIWYLPHEDGRGTVSGTHYILGSKFEKSGWFVDLEAYSKNAGGKMNLFAENISPDDNGTVTYMARKSNERNRGIDLFIQKRHYLFNHMLSYSLSSSEEQIKGYFGDDWFPGYNDRTHRLKLTEMVGWRKWTLTGSWQIAGGLPVFQYIPDLDVEEFTRSDNFSQVNVALVKTVTADFFTFSAGMSLLNVFNRKNIVEVNYLRFSSDLGSMTVRSDISALGFTPVFFMNIRF